MSTQPTAGCGCQYDAAGQVFVDHCVCAHRAALAADLDCRGWGCCSSTCPTCTALRDFYKRLGGERETVPGLRCELARVTQERDQARAQIAAGLALADEVEQRANDMVGIFSGHKGAIVPAWVGRLRRALAVTTDAD